MKREDVIAGVIAGTIFVTGCTVGIFGYKKMNEPIYVQSEITEDNQSTSVYKPVMDEDNKIDNTDNTEENDISREYVEDSDIAYQDSDAFDQLSDNTRVSIDSSVYVDNGDYNFNKYNNEEQQNTTDTYVLNTSTLKIHYPDCGDVKKISPENYETSSESIDELMSQGYTTCGHCF